MQLSIADLHEIVGGHLRLGAMPPREGEFAAIGRIVIDSRAIEAGDVFWALPGTTHDGSHFAEEALTHGASGIVTSGRWVAPWAGRWSLEVEDSTSALWRLAAWNCDRFSGRVVTIEGALGKTITAAMTAAVLKFRLVGETIANNNHCSSATDTAAALARLPSHHDYAIVELHNGLVSHAAPIGRIANADVAVFVHSGSSSLTPALSAAVDQAIIERLHSAVRAGGPVVVNGDDPCLRRAVQGAANVIFIGRDADAHVAADKVENVNGQLRFSVAGHRYCVAAWGRHHLTAALAAIAVGRLCGLTDSEIAKGLAAFEPLDRCCNISQAGEVTIIDDTSHARPAAAIAGMELLGEFAAQGRRLMLCGDVSDSDEAAPEISRALGEQAVMRAGADLLVACGASANGIAEGAIQAGMRRTNSVACRTADEAASEVLARLRPGDAVLLSGRQAAGVKQALHHQQTGILRRAA